MQIKDENSETETRTTRTPSKFTEASGGEAEKKQEKSQSAHFAGRRRVFRTPSTLLNSQDVAWRGKQTWQAGNCPSSKGNSSTFTLGFLAIQYRLLLKKYLKTQVFGTGIEQLNNTFFRTSSVGSMPCRRPYPGYSMEITLTCQGCNVAKLAHCKVRNLVVVWLVLLLQRLN